MSSAIGDRRSAIGDWRLATGDLKLAIGHWRSVIGDLRLAIGDWLLAISRFPWVCFFLWLGGGPARAAAAMEAQSLVIISPHHEFIRQEFQEAFSRWHLAHFGAPVGFDWRELGGSSDALRFVQSEFANRPDGIGIDCFFGGGQEPFLILADRGLVLPYDSPARAGIPASFNGIEVYDREFRWYGAALSSFGILQNRRLQTRLDLPFIRHWDELAQPRLLGWVGAGDPRNSGTMTVMYETILQAYGWERGWSLLARISANTRKFDRVSSTTAKDVTLGETVYAFAVDFYGFTQMAVAGRSNVLFALPEDFTSISPDGLAILKGAPHLAVARRFVDFVLSESGQKLWLLPAGHPEGPRQNSIERMPVRPELYSRFRGQSNIEFSPFELKSSFVYNARLARGRRDVVAGLFGALFVDSQRDLQRAWRMVIERGSLAAGVTELGRMPVTEAQASALATNEWRSATRRTQKKIEWQSWATAKYRRMQTSGAVALAN